MRDLLKDKAICEAATKGPWDNVTEPYTDVHSYDRLTEEPNGLIARCSTGPDAEFIAAARKGWPEAIDRALAAEKKADKFSIEIYCKDQQLLELENELKRRKMQAEINISIGETVINLQQENAELRQRIADLKEWLQTKKKQSSELYTDYDNAIVTAFEEVLRKLQGEETKE